MARLTLVAGLPGSGKSTFLASQKFDVIIDDYFATQPDDIPVKTIDDNKDPFKNTRYSQLVESLKNGNHVAVSDIMFCVAEHRNNFLGAIFRVATNVDVDFVFFENDPILAKNNVRSRNREGRAEKELDLIDLISKRYSSVSSTKRKIHDA